MLFVSFRTRFFYSTMIIRDFGAKYKILAPNLYFNILIRIMVYLTHFK